MAQANLGLKQLDRRRESLETAVNEGEVSERDFELIDEFSAYDLGQNAERTVSNHILMLRKTAERADDELAEMDAEQICNLLRRFQAGIHPDVKDGGVVIKNYVSALRKFYRFHNDLAVSNDRDIDIDSDYSGRDLSPSDLLYVDEVEDLLQAARRRNIRDMAAIAMMLATGQRIDAVRTLRLKHLHVDDSTMEVELNEKEGNLKGASGARPLLWAKHYVRPWYEAHPHRGNPEAALFPPEQFGKNLRDGDPEHRSKVMSDRGFRRMVRKAGEEAGLEKNLYPHLLRHCAITRMVAEGLSEQQIKNIAGWHGDSSQFETYVNLHENAALDSVRESLDYPVSESGPPVIGRPSLDECPSCKDSLPAGTERCPTCQTALTSKEAAQGTPDRKPDVDDITRSVQDMNVAESLRVIEAVQERIDEIGGILEQEYLLPQEEVDKARNDTADSETDADVLQAMLKFMDEERED